MNINIDESAGFCWGVVNTINKAQETIKKYKSNVYVLGEIIHNPHETNRLQNEGLITISHSDLKNIASNDSKVIIRAHGEPPSTYQKARSLGLNIIDATCPLVKALQDRVKGFYNQNYQIIIFGKKEHAEVIGLRGVCNDECIVIKNVDDIINNIDFNKKTVLLSQTTMDKPSFNRIKDVLEKIFDNNNPDISFIAQDTICKFVSGRESALRNFAINNDIVIFVAGKNSSNGKSLYNVCKSANNRTYFIENISDIDYSWFNGINSIGISGATSTPQWYMEKIKTELENKII